MSVAVDNRQVVLLKSLRTNNRFYALVDPDSGYKNADAIAEFPPDIPLGIAYPCLEDGLNDFAVIRTTFETIDVFPDDDELRTELMDIIDDARSNLVRRLQELRDRLTSGQAHFLGTELQEFKDHIVHMCTKGTIRRTLDNMMKVDVFESVARAEAPGRGGASDPMYHYRFLPPYALNLTGELHPRAFIGRVFDDVLDSVTNLENYTNKLTFDRDVFQKFIALMFVNYATTDPMFYGTSREDYGVSSDKDMQETPLYQAIAKALRVLERETGGGGPTSGAPAAPTPPSPPAPASGAAEPETGGDLGFLFEEQEDDFLKSLQGAGHTVEIPFGTERGLIETLASLAEAVRLLKHVDHPRAGEIRTLTRNAGKELFQSLQGLQIISPLANDPFQDT